MFYFNLLSKILSHRIKNLIFFFIVFSIFLNLSESITFKEIFIIQVLLILIFLSNFITINYIYLPFFLVTFFLFYFQIDLKYSAYLMLLVIMNAFFKIKDEVNFKTKDEAKIYFREDQVYNILIIILIFFSFDVKSLHLGIGIELEKRNILINFYYLIDHALNYTDYFGFFSKFYNASFILYTTKYTIANLDPNYSAILTLMVYNLFFFKSQKNFIKKFIIFSLITLFLTQSKSALIFIIVNIFFYRFKFSFNKKIFFFLLFNLFIFIASYLIFLKLPNPYDKFLSKEEKISQIVSKKEGQIYSDVVCDKYKEYFKYIIYFTDCGDNVKRPIILRSVFGSSTYYKFYTIGIVIDDFKKNLQKYVMPNRLAEFKNYDKLILNYYFSSHNLIQKIFLNYGILIGLIFVLNFYIFFKNYNNYNIFPAIFASSFVGLDIFLFLPIIIISFLTNEKK